MRRAFASSGTPSSPSAARPSGVPGSWWSGSTERASSENPPVSDVLPVAGGPVWRKAPTDAITNEAKATSATARTLRPGRNAACRKPSAATVAVAPAAARCRSPESRAETNRSALASSSAPAPKNAGVAPSDPKPAAASSSAAIVASPIAQAVRRDPRGGPHSCGARASRLRTERPRSPRSVTATARTRRRHPARGAERELERPDRERERARAHRPTHNVRRPSIISHA